MPVVNGFTEKVGVGFPPRAEVGGVYVARNPEVFPPARFDVETAPIKEGDPVRVKRTGTEGIVRDILREDPFGDTDDSWEVMAIIDTDRYKGLYFAVSSLERIVPSARFDAETASGELECPTCGRRAPANEWPEVLFFLTDGMQTRRCPDCWRHNLNSVPRPVRKRPSIVESIDALRGAGGDAWDAVGDPGEYLGRNRAEPEPWTPELGERVRHPGRGEGRAIARHDPDPTPLGFTVAFDDGSYGGPYTPGELEPIVPSPPVAAVVVRGLGCGETARVVLCRSEIEAAREQQRNGGVVVSGVAGQIAWA